MPGGTRIVYNYPNLKNNLQTKYAEVHLGQEFCVCSVQMGGWVGGWVNWVGGWVGELGGWVGELGQVTRLNIYKV